MPALIYYTLLNIVFCCSLATLGEANRFFTSRFKSYKLQCDVSKCSDVHTCSIRSGVQRCICDHRCKETRQTGPICGVDGVAYNNLCQLHLQECRTKKFILVKNYGKCAALCQDATRESESGQCKSWSKIGACETMADFMKMYCPATCAFCKLHAPKVKLACETSKYGCCYKSTKPAKGPNGKGCARKCQDRPWCKSFVGNCGDLINRATMKKLCPVACRYCNPKKKIVLENVEDE